MTARLAAASESASAASSDQEIERGLDDLWDRRIAADLIAEMEIHLADRVTTIPQMRRILAVKGYQGLRRRIEADIAGKFKAIDRSGES